jgi:Flp pilus assembly protein CpaB
MTALDPNSRPKRSTSMSNQEYMPNGIPGGPLGGQPQVLTPKGKGRRKKSDTGSRRSASSFRWLFLFFAAAVGVLGVVITSTPNDNIWVVRSKNDASVAALVAVDPTMFTLVQVDPLAVEQDTFSGPDRDSVNAEFTDAVNDKWFLYPMPAGQQVRRGDLVPSGDLATPLAADERLISISARAADAVAGTIRAGSVVDVYVSSSDGLTGVLGQGVEIVSVSLAPEQFDSVAQQQFQDPDKSLSDFVANQPIGGTYVIRVKAGDVASYIAADTAGKITLSLHGGESRVFTPVPTDILSTICGVGSAEPACVRVGQ